MTVFSQENVEELYEIGDELGRRHGDEYALWRRQGNVWPLNRYTTTSTSPSGYEVSLSPSALKVA
ncbi:hypothetical protein NHX12_028473, partial [Muraenolepis orangiensis]